MRPRKVVCFDLGGVLVEICRDWLQACQVAGLEPRPVPPDFDRQRSAAGADHQLGRMSDEDYYARVSEASAKSYDAAEVARVHHAWTLGEYPGVDALIAELSAHEHLTLACLSNTNAPHWERLAPAADAPRPEYPSLQRLEMRLASHLLGLAKPDSRIYAAARDHFGVAPEDIVFFDDLDENVRAARVAGWHAHCIDPRGNPASQVRSELSSLGLI